VEIGDVFIINKLKGSFYICKDPNKKFIIQSFSKSGLSVYYVDARTNIKCRCSNCRTWPDYDSYSNKFEKVRCIGISQIKIVEKRLERLRDQKLKRLLR